MTDRMPGDMPDRMSKEMPDRSPDSMPDRMPENMPDRTPSHFLSPLPQDLHKLRAGMTHFTPNHISVHMICRKKSNLLLAWYACTYAASGCSKTMASFFVILKENETQMNSKRTVTC